MGEKTAKEIYIDGKKNIYNLAELIKKDKRGYYIYRSGMEWKKFDYEKGLKALKNTEYYDTAIKNWPKDATTSLNMTKGLQQRSKKLPNIKLKLKESEKTAFEIYEDGKIGIYDLDSLIEKDEAGRYIYVAGLKWKQFDYKKGLDALIKKDATGHFIYVAGRDWKQFDYREGLGALKNTEYYKKALKGWPRDAMASLEMTKELRRKSKKLSGKKLKLKESEETAFEIYKNGLKGIYDLDGLIEKDEDGRYIYLAGRRWKEFDYKKGMDALIKKDETGYFIYWAGIEWKQFDYKRGFDALIKKDKDGKYIYLAGKDWKEFDFVKGLDSLIKKDKDGKYIYLAGKDWKEFDYRRGLNALIEKDDGYYIYHSGTDWKKFDYEKGLKALKNTEYYDTAIKNWPKDATTSLNMTKGLQQRSKKLPKKSLTLKKKRER